MCKAMEERGKDWSSISSAAKEATSVAISVRTDEISDNKLAWARSVGRRIGQYLSEEG